MSLFFSSIVVKVGVGVIVCLGFGLFWLPSTLSSPQSLKIYDRHGVLLHDQRSPVRKTDFVSLDEVDQFVRDSVIWFEDRRFYHHRGIDLFGIARALHNNLIIGGPTQGASTIDQQTMKLLRQRFGGRGRSDKIIESYQAFFGSFVRSKDDILLAYLNHLTFGQGVQGLRSACQIFFALECNQLSYEQQFFLFVKAKYPSRSTTVMQIDRLWRDMLSGGLAQRYGLVDHDQRFWQDMQQSLGFSAQKKAPYFVDYTIQVLQRYRYSDDRYQTAFDSTLYDRIETLLQQLRPYLLQKQTTDMCVVILEDKKIASMNLLRPYGGARDHAFLNGCLQKRQIGSAIKPFLYLRALERGIIEQDSVIRDEEVSFSLADGGIYQPKNFSMTTHGDVSIGQALGSSLNIPAVKLLSSMGVQDFYSFLKTVGEQVGTTEQRNDYPEHFGLSLALGSKEISPLDFVRMRTYFDQPGQHSDLIKQILSHHPYRLLSFGQHSWFDLPGWYLKSGTSRNFVDGRVCGGRDKRTICVWAGNYTAQPTMESGYHTAGVVFHYVTKMLD